MSQHVHELTSWANDTFGDDAWQFTCEIGNLTWVDGCRKYADGNLRITILIEQTFVTWSAMWFGFDDETSYSVNVGFGFVDTWEDLEP